MSKEHYDRNAIVASEDLVIDFHFLVQDLSVEKNISRAELAKKVGIKKKKLTKLLSPEGEPSLRQVAKILHALGEKPKVSVRRRRSRRNINDVDLGPAPKN